MTASQFMTAAALEYLGWLVTVVAVTGVILNNRRLRACFILWTFSNAASAAIHLTTGPMALVARDLIFLALAAHGWILWGKGQGPGTRAPASPQRTQRT